MDIVTDIEKLRAKADTLESLKAEFPDLHERKTRWRSVLVSKAVNAQPEGVELRHNCGCCSDSPLEAWFYIKRGTETIYADPPTVCIGERDAPWEDGWKKTVKKHAGEAGVKLLQPSERWGVIWKL